MAALHLCEAARQVTSGKPGRVRTPAGSSAHRRAPACHQELQGHRSVVSGPPWLRQSTGVRPTNRPTTVIEDLCNLPPVHVRSRGSGAGGSFEGSSRSSHARLPAGPSAACIAGWWPSPRLGQRLQDLARPGVEEPNSARSLPSYLPTRCSRLIGHGSMAERSPRRCSMARRCRRAKP
jgi:hypothetical protein